MSDTVGHSSHSPGEDRQPPTARFEPSVKAPGSRIGPFRIERELGHGGAGIVYLARDTKLNREVAIKSLPPQFANDVKTRARFQREAKLLASLNHPNIATIHEELEGTEGQPYLVLEYVPGETLGQRLARGGIALHDALAIALEIAEALEAAHAKGVIHRDLKPDNIRITPEGKTKVLDFGIAKMVGAAAPALATITEPGHIIGTPGYMSPEQARGEPADHRTDIWSFGCVLYEMLTGRCAFPGDTASEALASILKTDPDWQAMPPEASPGVCRIIGRCLQKNPEQRYQSTSELNQDLRRCRAVLLGPIPKALDLGALIVLLRRPRIAAGTVFIVLVLVAAIGHLINRGVKTRWARLEALPRIMEMIEREEYQQAFVLAQKAERYIPEDPVLRDLWPQICRDYSIISEPAGARVYYTDHTDFENKGEYLGTTPLEKIRHPLGIFRWEVEKEGFESRECVTAVYPTTKDTLTILLEPEDRNPGMVPMGSGNRMYWIDKYEVTNEQFQEFVDDGGYRRQELWTHTFIEDGNELSWSEAMPRFVDKTGRPGPATWEWGTFPDGQDNYPVSGVSWYEAAAYAQWAGKDLPVLRFWEWAADPSMFSAIIPYSNIAFKEGPAPVGQHKGTGRSGLYDAAGNVREWCWNATDEAGTLRHVCGGAWTDPDYAFIHTHQDGRPPISRDVTVGFRCARYRGGLKSLEPRWVDPVPMREVIDYAGERPLSDEESAVYKEAIYGYAPMELNDSNVAVEDGSRHWHKERIEFDAVYGGERITAYLFLPKGAQPPYQPVLYFPGTGAQQMDSSETLRDFAPIDFVIKAGRAVLYPVYKGTYERRFADKPAGWWRDDPEGDLEWHKCLVKDVRRSIDYLEKRARTQGDIDTDKLIYYGYSWGGYVAPIVLAVEDRIQAAVIVAGGFGTPRQYRAIYACLYAPRVKIPVLMVNGIGDGVFPLETSVRPMFELLGTPESDKELKVYDGGHSMLGLFGWQIQKDVLAWLDKYSEPPK